MSTREEIEAACEIVRKYKTMRAKYPLPETLPRFVDHARAVLADAYLTERAERQRRIEAAADTIKDGIFGNCRCGECMFRRDTIRDIITRCMDGETT